MHYRCFGAGLALVLILSGHLFAASTRFNNFTFEAQVVKSSGQQYREFFENKQTMLKVRPNEEYSIIVRNPLPVRVAVAVAIDGLNSIDGKRTSPRNAKKWIIAPNSSLTVSGWQTSQETARKFLFTDQSEAFAQWREQKEGKPYARNLGVIGVAWFWNRAELERALYKPQPFADEGQRFAGNAPAPAAQSRSAMAPSAPSAAPEERAGTGMGTQQQNSVTEVEFNGDAGMVSVKDVLKIYYEFAKEPSQPAPFVDAEEDAGRFAPDMHK